MQFIRSMFIPIVAVSLVLSSASALKACPFCEAPSLTLTEQIDQADAVVLAEWIGGEKSTDDSAGKTEYRIVEIEKNPGELKPQDDIVSLIRYRPGKKGDLVLLTGVKTTRIEWGTPTELSRAAWKYLINAPSPSEPTQKRLEYFVKYLEFPDDLVAADAYGEFANAPYKDIAPLADKFPRERLRHWVTSPETTSTRLGLYGLLLGLCGDESDAAIMRDIITKASDEYRIGIDGVMAGYLLLTGEEGLDVIDRTKLGENADIPFSETYSAMQALKFMWTYGDGRIEKERLRESMRQLLDRPELADLVITHLARWKDWSVQERLFEMYGEGDFDVNVIKRAIIRYMIASTKDKPKDADAKMPKHVKSGQKFLAAIRNVDPKMVEQTERFYLFR